MQNTPRMEPELPLAESHRDENRFGDTPNLTDFSTSHSERGFAEKTPEIVPAILSPIVIFEWEIAPDERAADEPQMDAQHPESEAADGSFRWIGDIDARLGYEVGEFPCTFEAWCEALHEGDRDRVLNAIEHHLETGEPYFEPCRAKRRDGSWLHFVHAGVATRDENGTPWKLTGTLSNFHSDEIGAISEAKADEKFVETPLQVPQTVLNAEIAETISEVIEPLEQGRARAESLLRTAAYLNSQLDLQDVCEAICEEAGRILGAPSAVMLFNKTRDAFVPTAVRDMPRDYDKRYIPTKRAIYDRHVAEMGTLFLFTDAQTTPDLPNHQLYLEVNMRTIGIASLIRDGEVLGLLKVYSFGTSRTFDENELALLQGLADLASQAIANARFFTESQRRLANIQALRQIDVAILGSSEVGVSLGVVLDQVVGRLGADAASVLLLNAHTSTLRYAGERGFRSATPRRTEWHLGEGLAGRAALERRLIYVPDLSQPDVLTTDPTGSEEKLPGLNPAAETIRRLAARHQETSQEATKTAAPSPANSTERTQLPPLLTRTRSTPVSHPLPAKQNLPAAKEIPNDETHLGADRSAWPAGLANENFVSYYAVPLVAAGQVRGILELWQRAARRLNAEELEFLETLAGQAAIAIDNANLFRDVQQSHDELVLAYDSTLEGWSGALDLRDKETEGHTRRVTSETLRLAEYMGLPDAELLQIRRGALLHDIGKMGIPDAVLLKPGPLSDEEWVIMKKHPTYALELLSPITYLRPALDIPYSHHEKWDGSGYPLGLSGEQIPLSARIFAVIDVWDALCSDRPYRKGWALPRVLKHIREGSGSHFDPQVVRAFLEMHPITEEEIEPEVEPKPESKPVAAPQKVPASQPLVSDVPYRREAIFPNEPIITTEQRGFFGRIVHWIVNWK